MVVASYTSERVRGTLRAIFVEPKNPEAGPLGAILGLASKAEKFAALFNPCIASTTSANLAGICGSVLLA
jgi:hypothetical protein